AAATRAPSPSTSSTATRAPSAAKRRATPSPCPFAPPVTTATLPASRSATRSAPPPLVREERQARHLHDLDREAVGAARHAALDPAREDAVRVVEEAGVLHAESP